jgi:hypothetical protein
MSWRETKYMVRPPLYLLLRLDARLALGWALLAVPSLAFLHPFLPVLRSSQEMRPTSLKRLGVHAAFDGVGTRYLLLSFSLPVFCAMKGVSLRPLTRARLLESKGRALLRERGDGRSETSSASSSLPRSLSLLFSVAGLPWVLLRYQKLFSSSPLP